MFVDVIMTLSSDDSFLENGLNICMNSTVPNSDKQNSTIQFVHRTLILKLAICLSNNIYNMFVEVDRPG